MSAFGITSLMDAFVTPAEATVWRMLYATGRLPMRVRMAIYIADPEALFRPATATATKPWRGSSRRASMTRSIRISFVPAWSRSSPTG